MAFPLYQENMSTTEEIVNQPAVETPAPEMPAAAAPETPAKPESMRETIAKAFRTSKDESVAPSRRASPQASIAPVAQTPAEFAMPKSLRKEVAAHWKTAHPELAQEIIRREADFEKGIQGSKEKALIADEFLNEIRPFEMITRNLGMTAPKMVGELMRTASILHTGSPVQKAQALAATMRQAGVTLEQVQQVFSGTAPSGSPAQPALDPQFSSLRQQVEQLTAAQQQREEAQIQASIREFGAKPEHKHFPQVRAKMAALLSSPGFLGETEGLSEQDQLKLAYDTAVWADPEIRKLLIAEKQTPNASSPALVQRAKQAAAMVHGAPASGPTAKTNAKDLRGIIANAMRAQR